VRKVRWTAVIGVLTLLVSVLAGANPVTSAQGHQQSSGPLVVWVDPPRVSAVKAFEKAYPNIPVKMNIINDNIGNDQLRGKFELFNKSGSGWPDVIFFPTNSDISWASSSQIHYTANLTHLLPGWVLKGYAKAAIWPCVINGQYMCLRNDDAADVLWYNAKLFKQWGYTPPRTWPQYEALALKIAKQHPGYYVGTVGTSYAFDRFFWGSECPANQLIGPDKVKIDLNSPNCLRMVNLLDKLLKAKVLLTTGLFTSATDQVGTKIVMTPGATWYGVFEFQDAFHVPAGQITASMPLVWPGQNVTGDEGGGLWGVSSHIGGQLLKNALKFLVFVTTNPKNQVDLVPTLPAYGPDEMPWLERNVIQSNYFADKATMVKAMIAATKMVWLGHPYTEFDPDGIWDQTVAPALVRGETLKQIWPTYQNQLVNYAQLYGYQVSQ
jgi:ABC-type glycerol-3-phosphate transport system substrate-binding protein